MLNTVEIAELVRLSTPTQSKYAVAKILGTNSQRVNAWYKNGIIMADRFAIKAAEIIDLPPEYLVSCLQAERAKGTDSYLIWQKICQQLTPQQMRSAG